MLERHPPRERAGQDRGDGRHHAERHLPGDGAGEAAHVVHRPLQLADRAVDALQQRDAGLGQLHPPPVPGEERQADLRLQQADLAGEGRLRQVQPVRGAAEGAGIGDLAEGTELLQIHPVNI